MYFKLLLYGLCLASNKVLIDTDIGVDDALGLLMTLASTETKIQAITLTHGNVKLDAVARNMFSLLNTLDLQKQATGGENYESKTPRIAVGASHPLKGEGYDPMGDDGLGGLTETHPELIDSYWQTRLSINKTANFHPNTTSRFVASSLTAADEILSQLKRLPPSKLTIIALGPLTNIALAIRKDPVAMARVKKIVVMGGAVHVPGNMSPFAEFNVLVDPLAADIVFRASLGIHVVLVPLDVTHTTQLTADALTDALKPIHRTPLANFTRGILAREFGSPAHPNRAEMFDPLAVAVALSFVVPTDAPFLNLRVEHQDPVKLGHCYVASRPSSNVQAVLAIDSPATFPAAFFARTFPLSTSTEII